MRLCSCLWGGVLNPIIPVFRTAPKEWSLHTHDKSRGYQAAKGYIRFFEPDVYVEASSGMAEKLGLGHLRQPKIDERLVGLEEFFIQDRHNISDATFGLNIFDVLKYRYESEKRFQLKDEGNASLLVGKNNGGISEAIFGTFPKLQSIKYVENGFIDVFEPQIFKSAEEAWLSVYRDRAITPLQLTREGLEHDGHGYSDLLIYVFDETKCIDLIDLWNIRLEHNPLIPVPLQLLPKVATFLNDVIQEEYRPMAENPNGIMHSATIEFGRSISQASSQAMIKEFFEPCTKGKFTVKFWRNDIWHTKAENEGPKFDRIRYSYSTSSHKLSIDEEGYTEVPAISPEFSRRFGGRNARWANVLKIRGYGKSEYATLLPFNTFNDNWPKRFVGNSVQITSEGWVQLSRYKNLNNVLFLQNGVDAIIGWLETKGVSAQLSDAGQISKQLYERIGGLWDLHIFKNSETLKLLNKMASSFRRRKADDEEMLESFEGRASSIDVWFNHIQKRRQNQSLPSLSVEDFTKREVLKLGIETKCTHCKAKNWSSLDQVDYELLCHRCLKKYEFPQSGLRKQNKNWKYRVFGPFALPDYARGSYSALLTVNAIKEIRFHSDAITFSPALELKFNSEVAEVDFALWLGPSEDWMASKEPTLFVGEAKSFAEKAFTRKDIQKLKLVAKRLPEAGIVFSVLKKQLSIDDVAQISNFVLWCRKHDRKNNFRRPILIMTAIELFASFSIQNSWQDHGGEYTDFANFNTTNSMMELADAMQQIHLGLPSYYEWLLEQENNSQKKS